MSLHEFIFYSIYTPFVSIVVFLGYFWLSRLKLIIIIIIIIIIYYYQKHDFQLKMHHKACGGRTSPETMEGDHSAHQTRLDLESGKGGFTNIPGYANVLVTQGNKKGIVGDCSCFY